MTGGGGVVHSEMPEDEFFRPEANARLPALGESTQTEQNDASPLLSDSQREDSNRGQPRRKDQGAGHRRRSDGSKSRYRYADPDYVSPLHLRAGGTGDTGSAAK